MLAKLILKNRIGKMIRLFKKNMRHIDCCGMRRCTHSGWSRSDNCYYNFINIVPH